MLSVCGVDLLAQDRFQGRVLVNVFGLRKKWEISVVLEALF